MTDTYEDIINLPHPEPKTTVRMSRQARAAQFSPFAALSGYGDEIDKTSIESVERKLAAEQGEEFIEAP